MTDKRPCSTGGRSAEHEDTIRLRQLVRRIRRNSAERRGTFGCRELHGKGTAAAACLNGRVYREPVESLSAECTRLRAELERALADADVARRITAPQRTIWTVAALVVVAASVAGVVLVARVEADRSAALEECRRTEGKLERAVDEDRSSYMGLYKELAETREKVESCKRDLAGESQTIDTLWQSCHCSPYDPLCSPRPMDAGRTR